MGSHLSLARFIEKTETNMDGKDRLDWIRSGKQKKW
jgi:hypothetical protein